MEERILTVKSICASPTFGLKLAIDPQYGQVYILNFDKKSSAALLFSFHKATCKEIWLSYLVEIASPRVFQRMKLLQPYRNY